MPASLWSWEKLLGEGTEGRDGEADTHECIRSDYTVTAGTIAAVNTSGQGSMQLSSPPQCSFDPARARATQEEFLSNWGSPTWESRLTLQGGSFHDLGGYRDPAWNVP